MNSYPINGLRILLALVIVLSTACSVKKVINELIELESIDANVPAIATIAANNTVLKFVAMGDVGTGKPGQFWVAKAVKNYCDSNGCDFILLLGDNMYQTGADSVDDEQFNSKFELPYKDINIPFHLVLGNHDYGSGGAGLEVKKGRYQSAYTNKSTKWKMPHHYYQYTINQTLFLALDTQAQLLGVDKVQRKNVGEWITNSNASWKIAYGHHPYKSNGPHGNAGKYDGISGINIVNGQKIKAFSDDVWCGKVDLYLSGHDHSRQWLKPTCSGTHLIVSGAGAKVTTLPGNNESLFQKNTLGFLYVEIKGNNLRADFINADGTIEFSHTIRK